MVYPFSTWKPSETFFRCSAKKGWNLRSNHTYYRVGALVDHRQERMPRRESPLQSEMVQGTLDMLILRTLVVGPAHGQTIAHAIERGSEEVLQVEHGSLYPALHRLQNRGWIASFWGTSENNRKAKYYRLTPVGK